MNFKQVIQKYGYPFISKETSEAVYYARKYLTSIMNDKTIATDRQTGNRIELLCRFIRNRQERRSKGVGGILKTEEGDYP